jgi:4-aminobutyrate aminotransferase
MFAFDHLHVPHVQTPLPGPTAARLLATDTVFVSGSYTRVYPLVVERGSGCVIEDVDGNRFLDFTAGIAVCNTGHCHPVVTAAIHDQVDKLLHMSGTDFYYRPQIELAQLLSELAPGPTAKKVFFANSGAEAIEAALKLARWHTHRSRVVAFFGAFHGRTYGAMSLSGSKLVHRRGFSPLVPDVHHIPFPRECPVSCMASRGCESPDSTACSFINEIESTLFKRVAPPEEVAAIFVEPIQGEGGYYPMPVGCLRALRTLCDKHGILMVVDEIQSGMGRTGKLFAIEHAGVEPDIVCTAKGIASGLPLGAIIAKANVMDWPPGSHASTFGGNPVACRAALATLQLLRTEYMHNAIERGAQLVAGLKNLNSPELTALRGMGLMLAIDLPNPTRREEVIQACFQRGLLLLGCGERALRFCPALCVNAEQVKVALRILGEVLKT